MRARGRGHELLEAGLVDLERRWRARDQRAVREQPHVDLVVADRHAGGQRDVGAEQERRQEGDAVGRLAVEPALLVDAHEGLAERIVGGRVRNGDGGALGERDVLDADLQPPPGVGVGDRVEIAVRQHREIGRHIVELARVDIEPDAEHRASLRKVTASWRGPMTVATMS